MFKQSPKMNDHQVQTTKSIWLTTVCLATGEATASTSVFET